MSEGLGGGHSSAGVAKRCTNCEFELVDVFCARCGEKQPDHHDLTIGHFFHELIHELVHLDSKLFGTLKTLIVRPGQLTVDYFAGRKSRYITPLRLFLVLFALHIVAYTFNPNTALYSIKGVISVDSAGALGKAIDLAAAKTNLGREAFIEIVDQKWKSNMSFVQLLNVLFLALAFKLLYFRRKRAVGEHLVFTTHLLAFAYLYALAIWPIYYFHGLRMTTWMMVILAVNNIILMIWMYLALRRYYAQSRGKTIVKTILGYVAMNVISMMLMYGTMFAAISAVMRAHRP